MKVRFRGDNLELEDGTFVEISKESLLEACLESDYHTISIFEIVKEAISKVLNCDVNRYQYRQSNLFNYLESGILADTRYQMRKAQVVKEEKLRSEGTQKGREASIERCKDALYKYLKDRNARIYHPAPKGWR